MLYPHVQPWKYPKLDAPIYIDTFIYREEEIYAHIDKGNIKHTWCQSHSQVGPWHDHTNRKTCCTPLGYPSHLLKGHFTSITLKFLGLKLLVFMEVVMNPLPIRSILLLGTVNWNLSNFHPCLAKNLFLILRVSFTLHAFPSLLCLTLLSEVERTRCRLEGGWIGDLKLLWLGLE